jgi:hypothetical protein
MAQVMNAWATRPVLTDASLLKQPTEGRLDGGMA